MPFGTGRELADLRSPAVMKSARGGAVGKAWSLAGRVWRQPTILSTGLFAASGAAFAIGNLMLARAMPVPEFGRMALAIALITLFGLLAPFGIDQLVLRARLAITWRLALLIGGMGCAMGCIAAIGAALTGGLRPAEAVMLAPTIAAIGLSVVVSGVLRSEGRTRDAIPFATGSPWILLAIGCLGLAQHFATPFWPLTLFMVGNMVRAVVGWWLLFRERRGQDQAIDTVAINWGEAFSLTGVAAVGTALVQLERLIIPLALMLSDLALFAVLASVAIFPFRLLIQAAGFTLTARLAATSDLAARRRLIRGELLIMALLAGAATVGILLVAAPLTPFLTGGRYAIDEALVAAACLNGSVKLLYALPRSVVTVCGSRSQVARLNGIGILWLVLAAAGGTLGGGWGLTGLILGVSAGGLLAVVPLWMLAKRTVSERPAPVTLGP